MLLAVDAGNTQTVLGLYDGDRLVEHCRIAHESAPDGDELACTLRALVDLPALDGIVLSSIGAAARAEYEAFAERGRRRELLVLGPGVCDRHPDPLRRAARGRPGPDRERGRGARAVRRACVVVDFGTSTNFDVVSAAGEFAGGVLAPGIEISMDALFARAARLSR